MEKGLVWRRGEGGLRSRMQGRAGHKHFSRFEPQPIRCPLAYQPLGTLGDGTDGGRYGEGGDVGWGWWC